MDRLPILTPAITRLLRLCLRGLNRGSASTHTATIPVIAHTRSTALRTIPVRLTARMELAAFNIITIHL
jgi:hypothetical protein